MRLLQRMQHDRHVAVMMVGAVIGQHVVTGHARHDAAVGIDKDLARFVVVDIVVADLVRRHAAADPDIEAPTGEVIEHRDLLQKPQRRIERQQINQRTEPDMFVSRATAAR
jgi:hypothetical protein